MKTGIKMTNYKKERRKKRVHSKFINLNNKPRLIIFRSNRFINAQIIDEKNGKTLFGVDEKTLKLETADKKVEKAKMVGKKIAEIAIKKGIKEVIFDRNGYKYHGRVKSLADGAREQGLVF